MASLPFDSLPVVLVSAKDHVAASTVISEIIDNEITDIDKGDRENAKHDRVWRLVNKYYSTNVRMHPLVDDEDLQIDANSVEAHIIYLTEDECAGGAGGASGRCAARARAGGGASVRLLVCGAAPPADAAAWAARARYEPVDLRAAPPPRRTPFGADDGVQRARDALHAHVWPPADVGISDASSDEWTAGEEDEEGEEGAESVERAERFAAALSALPAACAAHRAELGEHAERAERLARAEQLVAAFLQALGGPSARC